MSTPDEPSPRREWDFAGVFLAWLVIVLVAGFTVISVQADKGPRPTTERDELSLKMMELQGKWLVGVREVVERLQEGAGDDLSQQIEMLNAGGVHERLRYVVLKGELASPEDAIVALDWLEDAMERKGVDPKPFEQDLGDLRAHYKLVVAGTGTNRDIEARLTQSLEWFGRLATMYRGAPGREAFLWSLERMGWIVLSGLFFLGLLGLVGAAGICVLGCLVGVEKVKAGIASGGGRSTVYAETFALWIVLFLLFNVAAHLFLGSVFGDGSLMPSAIGSFGSLIALAWTKIRGLRWGQVRSDIGWVGGRLGVFEPLAGAATYAMSLPLLVLGVVLMFLLDKWTGGGGIMMGNGDPESFDTMGGAGHPLADMVDPSNIWSIVVVYLLASVVAPIVEETMFRGVLYRHLRDATGRWATVLSVLFSGIFTAFIFAAIHPQGLIAIPALMALAIGFALSREWRNSLIAPMVAHGLSNAVVVTFLILLVSS